MKEAITREQLFEELYGYPIRLAESVLRLHCIDDERLSADIVEFHEERIRYVDDLLTKGIY